MKKIVLTTEQAQRLFNIINEQNLDTDNIPNVQVDVDSSNINPNDVVRRGIEAASNLGLAGGSYNLNVIPDTATQNGDNETLVGTGETMLDKVTDFKNQFDNVPNKQNVIGQVNIDANTMKESITKSIMEQKRIANIKKNGYTYSKKDFDTFLMN